MYAYNYIYEQLSKYVFHLWYNIQWRRRSAALGSSLFHCVKPLRQHQSLFGVVAGRRLRKLARWQPCPRTRSWATPRPWYRAWTPWRMSTTKSWTPSSPLSRPSSERVETPTWWRRRPTSWKSLWRPSSWASVKLRWVGVRMAKKMVSAPHPQERGWGDGTGNGTFEEEYVYNNTLYSTHQEIRSC